MQIRIHQDYPSLSRATADLIKAYITRKPRSLVCVASGHTPIGTFQCLADDVKNKQLDLAQTTFVSLDEWLGIDPDDPGSCIAMLQRDFFEPAGIVPERQVCFDVAAADLEAECRKIDTVIAANGGLDIMLVGVGTNAHIGMNEPGTPFDLYAHVGKLAAETIAVGQKYFSKATTLSNGITLGLAHLKEARLPIIIANGEKKAQAVARALTEMPSIQVPMSVAQHISQGYVMLDKEAAGLLSIPLSIPSQD